MCRLLISCILLSSVALFAQSQASSSDPLEVAVQAVPHERHGFRVPFCSAS
jgi:hypothetical protein